MRNRIIGVWCCLFLLTLAAGAQAQTTEGEKWQVREAHFTGDGKRLVVHFTSRNNSTVQQLMGWDIASGRVLFQSAVKPGIPLYKRVYGFPVSADGMVVEGYNSFIFSPDGTLYRRINPVWPGKEVMVKETATGETVSTLELTRERLVPQGFSPDGKLLAGLSLHEKNVLNRNPPPGRLEFWDTRSGKPVALFESNEEEEHFSTALFSADNRLLVLIGRKQNEQQKSKPWVAVYDRTTGKRQSAFFTGDVSPLQFTLSPDGQTLATLPHFVQLHQVPWLISLWNTQTGTLMHSLPLGLTFDFYVTLRFSSDSGRLRAIGNASVSSAPLIQNWNTTTGQPLPQTPPPPPIHAVADPWAFPFFATNGPLLARSFNGHTIEVFSLEEGKVVNVLEMN